MSVKCSAGEYGIREISLNYPLEYGVPQGSCLGLPLFLIYCNDLPINLTLCNSILFADNTTLYKGRENLVYLKWCLQEELSMLMDWFCANKLTLNLTKSVCMLFHDSHKNIAFELSIAGVKLPTVQHTKFLGVYIDSKLKWDHHVNKLILKIKHNRHLLKTGKNMLSIHAKKIVYFSHIQSHITYCMSTWGNLISNSQLSRLQSEQDKCVELVKHKGVHIDLKILPISVLLYLENCKFGYKLVNLLLPLTIIDCCVTDSHGQSLQKGHTYNTRNKNLPNIPKAKTTKYLKSVLCHGVRSFSELPSSVKESSSVSSFIYKCKKHIFNKL